MEEENENIGKSQSFWLFLAWAVATLATAGSLYMSEVMHFTPCSLCWFQRIFMYPLSIVLGIAFVKEDIGIVKFTLPLAIIGGGFSIYHIIIQNIPPDSTIAACGPTSCQDDYLYWFGFITIPMLALLAFTIIVIALLRLRRLDRA